MHTRNHSYIAACAAVQALHNTCPPAQTGHSPAAVYTIHTALYTTPQHRRAAAPILTRGPGSRGRPCAAARPRSPSRPPARRRTRCRPTPTPLGRPPTPTYPPPAPAGLSLLPGAIRPSAGRSPPAGAIRPLSARSGRGADSLRRTVARPEADPRREIPPRASDPG